MKNKTKVIIAGIDEGRERYLLYAKSTPNETVVEWSDNKDHAYNFRLVEKARAALNHMRLPVPCCVVVRHQT